MNDLVRFIESIFMYIQIYIYIYIHALAVVGKSADVLEFLIKHDHVPGAV